MTRHRRAGSRWRIKLHRMRPGGENGAAVELMSHPHRLSGFTPDMKATFDDIHSRYAADMVLPDTELDEVVCGRWFHLEQLDVGFWWLDVGGVVLHVRADRDGRPTRVTVHTAGMWNERVAGCSYEVDEQPDDETEGER